MVLRSHRSVTKPFAPSSTPDVETKNTCRLESYLHQNWTSTHQYFSSISFVSPLVAVLLLAHTGVRSHQCTIKTLTSVCSQVPSWTARLAAAASFLNLRFSDFSKGGPVTHFILELSRFVLVYALINWLLCK